MSQPPAASQIHIDLGALAQRVTGTENAIANLSNQFTDLSNSFSSQMRDLGKKLDGQNDAFAASRATNWPVLLSAVGVVIMLVGAVLWPQMEGLAKVETLLGKMQDTYVRVSDLNASSEILRGRLTKLDSLAETLDAAKLGIREHEEFKTRINGELAQETSARKEANLRTEQALRDLDAQLVKRPEINAANKTTDDRIDALSVHCDALQKQVNDALAGAVNGLATRGH